MLSPANDNPARLPTLTSLALKVGGLQGWHRNLAAALFGASLTLSLPPYFLLPFLPVALCGLYWMVLAAQSRKRAFFDGWWFGYGMFAFGLYWIVYALLVDAKQFGWLVPFAAIGVPGGLALVIAALCAAFYSLRHTGGLLGIWLFASFWWLAELFRGHAFTGFPWNLMGYAWSFSETTLQFVSFFGVYNVGLFTVFLALLPVTLSGAARITRMGALGALALFGCVLMAGYMRVSSAPRDVVDGVTLRLVQPAIEQKLKWDPRYTVEGVQKLATLSLSAGKDDITHIIWPEAAMPFPFASHDTWAQRLAELVPPGGVLMAGVTRVEGRKETQDVRIYNSMQAVNGNAEVVMAYDKVKLVPFGEFVPLREILPIEKITHGTLDFTAGTPGRNFSVRGLPDFRPLICYESIFPALAAGERPGWLLNITNDAWFGDSSGPRQHLEMARARAVEQGVPLIRVANTGISAVVDAYGRIIKLLPLGITGVIDSPLPRAALAPPLFARFGKYISAFPFYFTLAIVYCYRRRIFICDAKK